MRAVWIVRTVSQFIQSNFQKSLESDEAVTGADLEGLVEGTGVSSFSANRVQPSLGMGSQGAPQDVGGVLVPGHSGQDALTSGFFRSS